MEQGPPDRAPTGKVLTLLSHTVPGEAACHQAGALESGVDSCSLHR